MKVQSFCFVRTECGCRNDLLIKIYAECMKNQQSLDMAICRIFFTLLWKIKESCEIVVFLTKYDRLYLSTGRIMLYTTHDIVCKSAKRYIHIVIFLGGQKNAV